MSRAFISVGSNINPEENVRKAILELSLRTRIIGVSTVYLTEPEGRRKEALFYNCVVEVDTVIPPEELKYMVLRGIEDDLGRRRVEDKFAERTIDLDLILYEDLILDTDRLKIPDPQILIRPFLVMPLKELRPGLRLPGSGLKIDDVAGKLKPGGMKPLESYTEGLRKEIYDEDKP